jgi:DNA-binding NarL/FixJ family response regulator
MNDADATQQRELTPETTSPMSRDKQVRIRVLLVDDYSFVREGLRSCLLRYDHFEIVGEAANGMEALLHAKRLLPDVIVMDIEMPGMNGLHATRWMREVCPEAKVLILTVHDKKEFVRQAIEAGARGYLRKNTSPIELVSALERIHRGETFFTTEMARPAACDHVVRAEREEPAIPKQLSEGELETLKLIMEGLASHEWPEGLWPNMRPPEPPRPRL